MRVLAPSSDVQREPKKLPKDLAARSRKLRELHGLEPDVILRETFAMPLHAGPPVQPRGFFFCSRRARRSAGFPSAAGFEVRPIPSAAKIERPTAVRTVFERPAG